jgi:hypothetical protein
VVSIVTSVKILRDPRWCHKLIGILGYVFTSFLHLGMTRYRIPFLKHMSLITVTLNLRVAIYGSEMAVRLGSEA